MKQFGLTDHELFPLLNEGGDRMLRRLREHPHAPKYNWQTGERLTAAGLANVRAYAERVRAVRQPTRPGAPPDWVTAFVRDARANVPFYRDREGWPSDDDFSKIPLTTREDIRRAAWTFVPDSRPTSDLIVYTTSGTSGARLTYPACAETPARYLPLFEKMLSACGVGIEGGERVSIVQACCQNPTVALCSISTYLNGAGFVKVNLHETDWKDPGDCEAFLNDCDPEIYTGDPFALSRLMRMALHTRPKAIISAASSLSSGLRRELTDHFACPVIDMYSMNESGPIAYSIADGEHELVQPNLYVEVLDKDGRNCEPGVQGQIVLTGGINPYLPLVRYATRDYAAMHVSITGEQCLRALHGRTPVTFCDRDGRCFNSIDVSTALGHLPLAGVALHQREDGSLIVRLRGANRCQASVLSTLRTLFGVDQAIDVLAWEEPLEGKAVTFSSALRSQEKP